MDRLYLDHAATTPILPAALAAMTEGLRLWANPSSPHAEGRAAKRALEDARERIKATLGWAGSVIFTSGASEAAALAFTRTTMAQQAISAVEHDAIRRAAPDATLLPVDGDGLVDTEKLEGPALVAIQAVNSETGVVQRFDAVARRLRAAGCVWLADCAQSAGKLPLPPADLIIVSAHKFGGPPGIGALLVRDPAMLRPGGGQEGGYRGGTENLPAILGFAAAIEATTTRDRIGPLRQALDAAVRAEGGTIVADGAERLPEIASYRLPGVSAMAQLMELDAAGIAVSAGSACSSGSLRPSAVLTAMGWPDTAAREVIRVSLAPTTTRSDVDRFLDAWGRLARRRRAA